MKRVVIPELLDTDSGSPEEVRASLADLVSLNRYLGGHDTTAKLLLEVAHRSGKRQLSFLDIGGGSGEFAVSVQRQLRTHGIDLHCTVLDRAITHLDPGDRNRVHCVAADARHIPFSERTFDVVGCNLFCHHLEPDELISFFHDALRASRIAVLINDLRRNYFHWLAACAGCILYRSRLTRHDAPASVRRAYTAKEMLGILRQTRASDISLHDFYFQRMGAIAWR